MRLLLLLVALAVALVFVPAAPVARAADLDRAVLAYYYTWFDPASFGPAPYQPETPYQSDDQAVMARHIAQAQAAGLDGFVVDWLGDENRTDVNFGHLLDLAERASFSATIHFDTPTFWG